MLRREKIWIKETVGISTNEKFENNWVIGVSSYMGLAFPWSPPPLTENEFLNKEPKRPEKEIIAYPLDAKRRIELED